MTLAFVPSHHISFDYKSTCAYVMQMLQGEFGYDILLSDDFEALIDELDNDIADQCFKPVAGILAGTELGLWEINFYEDTYHLAVVPHAHADAFKAYWSEGFRNDPEQMYDVKPKLRLIAAPKTASKPRPPAAKKINLIEASVKLAGDAEFDIDRAVDFVWNSYSKDDDNGKFVDFSVWPPRDAPLPTRAQDRDFAGSWSQVYQDGAHNIWKRRERAPEGKSHKEGTFRLAQIDSMERWSPRWLGGGAGVTDFRSKTYWMNGSFVHIAYCAEEKGKFSSEVVHISDTACESWYKSREPLQVVPFPDAPRCLIVKGDKRLAIAEGPVLDDAFFLLPEPLYSHAEEGVIALADEVVVYFTETRRWLKMHRLDTRTMRHEVCLLEGFGHTRTVDGQLDAGVGIVEVCQGHGDWWIFNHRTNAYGKVDVAMFWNAQTDETFKIAARDVAHQQPTIIYQRALGRYLAVQYRTVSLLVEFETIYDSKEKHVLEWDVL